ncbi:protein GL2-INTERACTING REPRESSOR 1-like [Cornus florida]|uniref:protein GL2-INTERACTING REPRESSOR 1-like n=1 Tax=Cornus florida TaxID=4283 RepID=UPI00289DC373|nr:protein GL2-INTERACTING REPRESSOR 1-like [Cornus florida]
MDHNAKSPKLDLKLHLSPPRSSHHTESANGSVSSMEITSPLSSCVSSELSVDETQRYSSSPETTSMMLAGCPRCLVYLMLSKEDPRCPKCKSTVLLDFHEEMRTKKTEIKKSY